MNHLVILRHAPEKLENVVDMWKAIEPVPDLWVLWAHVRPWVMKTPVRVMGVLRQLTKALGRLKVDSGEPSLFLFVSIMNK